MSRHAGGLLAGPACPPLPPENACAGAAGCGGAARDAHGVAQRWRARSGDGARHWAQQPPPLYRRRRPGNRSTCWWCGCHSVSAARASQLTAHAPRHAMITAACGPTARVLWQHAWALAPVCSTWLVSHARAADTCRAARARDPSGRRGTSSGRVNWRPLTRTCGWEVGQSECRADRTFGIRVG